MEGSSTDKIAPNDRVWIYVKSRYAKILEPDERRHHREAPKPYGRVEKQQKLQESRSAQTEAPVYYPDDDTSHSDENHEHSTGYDGDTSSRMGSETGSLRETEELEGSPALLAEPGTEMWLGPPTTSKAPPPAPMYGGWDLLLEQEKAAMDGSGHKEGPLKDAALQVKEEPMDSVGPRDGEHKHLSEMLPYVLESEVDFALRENIGVIYESQPEWLRMQLRSEIRKHSERCGGRLNTREANTLMWRNYRLKVSQVVTLFGVHGGMSKVVDACLRPIKDSEVQPTG